MKKEFLDYICSLHGYLIRIKEIHWSTDSDAEHKLCDELLDELGDLEDEFAETAMGFGNKKIEVGELKPMLPNAETLKPMLKELQEETAVLKNKLNAIKEGGLNSILDDVLAFAQKYMYRATQV